MLGPIASDKLRAHVRTLAGELAERNGFGPQGLHAAADFIARERNSQGYRLGSHTYEVHGIACAHYHMPADTPDKLTHDAPACVTAGLCRAVTALAAGLPRESSGQRGGG